MDEEKFIQARIDIAVLQAQRVEDQKALKLVADGFKFLLGILLVVIGLLMKGR